jgi:hypothetical protein
VPFNSLVILNIATEMELSSSGCAVITNTFGPCAEADNPISKKNKKKIVFFINKFFVRN